MTERFITSTLNNRDDEVEQTIRPTRFDAFPGQPQIKERLQILIAAAKGRNEPLGHILFSGAPGLGKTTLAHIVANEKEAAIKSSSGPAIEKPGDLAGLLTSLEDGDILFIDEIHRLSTTVEEYLYSAMEDFFIDIMLDQGPGARSVRLNLPRFTLIGATTRQGMISAPLRSRFLTHCRLDYYNPEDLTEIIRRSAGILDIPTDSEGALEIARRARGTARIANNLLRWVRDYAQVKSDGTINAAVAEDAMKMLDIDPDGLDEMDKRILETLIFKFNCRPVGLRSLAVAIGEEQDTIEDVYEPYLIQEGFILRTPQGRLPTAKAESRFGSEPTTFRHHGRARKSDDPNQPNLL